METKFDILYKGKTLKNHTGKCGEYDVCTIRTSNVSHLYWKKLFIRIHYILAFVQIWKLIRKSIVLRLKIKQLIFISEILCVKVIIKYLNCKMFYKVTIIVLV